MSLPECVRQWAHWMGWSLALSAGSLVQTEEQVQDAEVEEEWMADFSQWR